jgi:3-oxoacyl-[acyl-carrier protein] reductase
MCIVADAFREEDMFSLAGKVALVTGASQGIGRAIALQMARAGADVGLASRNEEKLSQVAAEVTALGRRARVLVTDVACAGQVQAMIEGVLAAFGRLDILVNNAGQGATGDVATITEEAWDRVIDTNLKGAFLCAQAAAAVMRAQSGGRILNIASVAGETGGVAGAAHYTSSKGGLLALTKTFARDLAPAGITVNAICPGQIETEMGRVPPDRLPELLKQIPLARLGAPDDIAYAAVFLASDEAGYITGATLDVNGGILKR